MKFRNMIFCITTNRNDILTIENVSEIRNITVFVHDSCRLYNQVAKNECATCINRSYCSKLFYVGSRLRQVIVLFELL